jgi:hypothetical protein
MSGSYGPRTTISSYTFLVTLIQFQIKLARHPHAKKKATDVIFKLI